VKVHLRWILAVATVMCSLVACDPLLTVRASVRTTAACASPTSGAYEKVPSVSGAEVVLRCPEGKERVLGVTDATGQFTLREVGLMQQACSLTVRKSGYESQMFAVEEVCVGRRSTTYCYGAVITADLSPQASASARSDTVSVAKAH
jgi:hypothetical protein